MRFPIPALFLPTLLLAAACGLATFAAEPPQRPAERPGKAKARKPKADRPRTAADGPWYVDDEKFANDFYDKLTELAKQGKCLAAKELHARLDNRKCQVPVAMPAQEPLTPQEVYERALASVFVIGSVVESEREPGKWDTAGMGTAWAVTDDGVMATNAHLFTMAGKECFGVADHHGKIYPVTAVLGSDPTADVALIRVAGKGFTPLPVALDEPVGGWVGVLSHPGGQLFSFTQGYVTRYMQDVMDGKSERWMCVSADYAVGSSGAPVLNRFGSVVGMATLTSSIDAEEGPEPDQPKTPAEAAEKPPAAAKAKEPKSKDAKSQDAEPRAEPPVAAAEKRPGDAKAKPPGAGEKPSGPESPAAKPNEPEPSTLQMVVKLVVPGRVIRDFCSGKPTPAAEGEKPGGKVAADEDRRRDLAVSNIDDLGLAHLEGLKRVKVLILGGTKITDAGLQSLRDLHQLEELYLQGTQTTDAGLAHLAAMSGLRVLDLTNTAVTGSGLAQLKGLRQLDELRLRGAPVADAALAHLAPFARLRILDLQDTPVTDAGLAHLKPLVLLEKLDLDGTKVTDAGLEQLEGLSQLQELSLGGTNLHGDGLKHLGRLPRLRSLHLFGTGLTDSGVAQLKACTQLSSLNLGRTSITDQSLEHLARLDRLHDLYLYNDKLTADALKKLQQALPNCKFYR